MLVLLFVDCNSIRQYLAQRTLITSAGSGDTMCGASLKLALKNRSKIFMRLNEGVYLVLLL